MADSSNRAESSRVSAHEFVVLSKCYCELQFARWQAVRADCPPQEHAVSLPCLRQLGATDAMLFWMQHQGQVEHLHGACQPPTPCSLVSAELCRSVAASALSRMN